MKNRNDSSATSADDPISGRMLEVLRCESAALQASILHLESKRSALQSAVELLSACRGRVIVTGMGKMSCIARKAAATFCSTGTPAIFLHPGEAVHGDLGIVTPQDCMLFLSHSGETREILELVPFTVRFGVSSVAVTSRMDNSLARRVTATVATGVSDEADAIAGAPTNSTTVSLAICDAMALALMDQRGFTAEQFAIFHPGGYLGNKLLIKVSDVMRSGDEIPISRDDDSLRQGIDMMSQKRLGAVFVVGVDSRLKGVLTDGDLRRMIERSDSGISGNILDQPLSNQMNDHPKSISRDSLAAEALRLMEDHGITVLPVTDEQSGVVGVIHMHDLVRAGLA